MGRFNIQPLFSGLFRAAIAQSGSLLCPWTYQRNYKHYAYELARTLNLTTNATSQQLLDFLQTIPAKQIQAAHASFKVKTSKSNPFGNLFSFLY